MRRVFTATKITVANRDIRRGSFVLHQRIGIALYRTGFDLKKLARFVAASTEGLTFKTAVFNQNIVRASNLNHVSVVAIPESNIADRDIASVTDAKSVDGLRIGKIFGRSGFIQLTVHIPDATFDDDIAVAFSLIVFIGVIIGHHRIFILAAIQQNRIVTHLEGHVFFENNMTCQLICSVLQKQHAAIGQFINCFLKCFSDVRSRA